MEEENKAKALRVVRWALIILLVVVGVALLVSLATSLETVIVTINIQSNTSPESVQEILDILEEQEASATFFISAAWAETNPDTAKTIAAKYEVACYTYSEARLAPLSNESLEKEIIGCKETLENITNTTITGFRAPARDLGGQALLLVAKNYEYDSSTFGRYGWFWEAYPPALLPMPTSSILIIPADDTTAMKTLRLGDSYYWLLRRAKQQELLVSFSSAQLEDSLLDFEYLLAHYREKGVTITGIQQHLNKKAGVGEE